MAEYWFHPPGMEHGRRKDLFGFVDVVAVGWGHLVMVQTTTHAHRLDRVRKIMSDDHIAVAREMIEVPGLSLHVHGWMPNARRPTIEDVAEHIRLQDAQSGLPF